MKCRTAAEKVFYVPAVMEKSPLTPSSADIAERNSDKCCIIKPSPKLKNIQGTVFMKKINTINLVASIFSAVSWLYSPFINSPVEAFFGISSSGKDILWITLYDLTMNLDINAENLLLCLASGGSAICIIGTFASVIKKDTSSVEMYSILGAFSMSPVFIAAFIDSQGHTAKEIFATFGYGYNTIFLLFILILIVSFKNVDIKSISDTKANTQSNNIENNKNHIIGNSSTKNLISKEKEILKNELKRELLFQMREELQNGTKTCICRTCKKEIPEDCSFCGYCGNSLS